MKNTSIVYYDWFDIQKEICKEMHIDEQYFRDYHNIIGGAYKDLWHEWLIYFDDVNNDIIKYNDLGEDINSKLNWVNEDNKNWLEPFVYAVYKIWDKYKIEWIRYSW